MGSYYVRVPVVGMVGVYVDAISELEAIESAVDKVNQSLKIEVDGAEETSLDACDRVVMGNAFLGPLNRARAIKEDAD